MPCFTTYTCERCGYCASGEEAFSLHLRIAHNAGMDIDLSERRGSVRARRLTPYHRCPYRCPFCRNRFTAAALRTHHIALAHRNSHRAAAFLASTLGAPTRYDGGGSQQGVQGPTISIQQFGSRIVTTMTFPNDVQVRSSSATGGDNDQSFTKVDSPGQNVKADPARKDCPVCFDEYDASEHVFYPCGHSLCQACFTSWKSACRRRTNRCPVCQEPY